MEINEALKGKLESIALTVNGETVPLSTLQATQLLRGMFYVASDRKLAVWDQWKGKGELEAFNALQEKLWVALENPEVNLFD